MRHVETLPDEEVKLDAVNLINRFLSKDYPNLPPPEEIMVWYISFSATEIKVFSYALWMGLGHPLALGPPDAGVVLLPDGRVGATPRRGEGGRARHGRQAPLRGGGDAPETLLDGARRHRGGPEGGRQNHRKDEEQRQLALHNTYFGTLMYRVAYCWYRVTILPGNNLPLT